MKINQRTDRGEGLHFHDRMMNLLLYLDFVLFHFPCREEQCIVLENNKERLRNISSVKRNVKTRLPKPDCMACNLKKINHNDVTSKYSFGVLPTPPVEELLKAV